MEFQRCIYCKKSFDDCIVSKSDIIPDFLGDGLVLEDAVCKECNNRINSEIELPIRDNFQYLRSQLDLKGRRGKPVRVEVNAEVGEIGEQIKTNLDHVYQKGLPPFEYRGADGKKYYSVCGKTEYTEVMKQEITHAVLNNCA
jgi:hypothetical protein